MSCRFGSLHVDKYEESSDFLEIEREIFKNNNGGLLNATADYMAYSSDLCLDCFSEYYSYSRTIRPSKH